MHLCAPCLGVRIRIIQEHVIMVRTFVCQNSIILCRDVISQVVVENQPQETVEKCEINLLIDL